MPLARAAKERYAQSRMLIVAHHEESVAWTLDIPTSPAGSNFIVVIYSDTASGPGYRLVPPGRGKEARAYFTAIVDHYDRLPDAMAFIHGHPYSWHTWAGTGNNVGNTWRMAHLTWPVNEYYVSLSVRCGRSCLHLQDEQHWRNPHFKCMKVAHRAGSSPAPCSVRSPLCLASPWHWERHPGGMRCPKRGGGAAPH